VKQSCVLIRGGMQRSSAALWPTANGRSHEMRENDNGYIESRANSAAKSQRHCVARQMRGITQKRALAE